MATAELLKDIEAVIDTLTKGSLQLARAANWAEKDRDKLSPMMLIGNVMKHVAWRNGKRYVASAVKQLSDLRLRSTIAHGMPDAEVAVVAGTFETLDDVLEGNGLGISLTTGEPGIVSMPGQAQAPEFSFLQRVETARLSVDNLLSEVGQLHRRLRGDAAASGF